MNVCLISDKYPPDVGGLANAARRLAQGVARSGHSLHVCVLSQDIAPGQVEITQEETGLTAHRLGQRQQANDSFADCFNLVARLHAQTPFDALHGYYLVEPAFITVYAGRFLGAPSVVSARGQDLDRAVFDPKKAAVILWTLEHADIVTAVSNDLARRARALAPAADARVIFNGVDAHRFTPTLRDRALMDKLALHNGPIIAFVGEARLEKGLNILLPAFAKVVCEWKIDPPPQLLLIGGARQDDADVARVFRLKYPDLNLRVVPYTGQADLPPYYNLLDALVLPSLQDGLPNALLEGMACACPVIASQVGGIPDAVRHGQNGLLVPPGDVDALAAAMSELLSQPDRRAELGRAARQTVLRDFTPERELAENLELYRQLKQSTDARSAPSSEI